MAFSSAASNLVPQDTNGDIDVFVRDRFPLFTSLKPNLTHPVPGSTVRNQVINFKWTSGIGGWNTYRLKVGSYRGGHDLFDSGEITDLNARATLLLTLAVPSLSDFPTERGQVGGNTPITSIPHL
ncbi:hypothetical protein [Nitrospira sp. M1]